MPTSSKAVLPPAYWITAIAVSFGTYYSVLADISALFPFASDWTSEQRAAMRLLTALATGVLVLVALLLRRRVRRVRVTDLEFVEGRRTWFPAGREARISTARRRLEQFAQDGSWPLRLASISGEWDTTLPLTSKEWGELLANVQQSERRIRVLLAHPSSPHLRARCDAEPNQQYRLMRERIVICTRHLMSLAELQASVRWSLQPIQFHLLGGTTTMYVSPFADRRPGHDSPCVKVAQGSTWFEAMSKWFDAEWDVALAADREIEWVERGIARSKAVFLDRDDTLIKNVSYFDDPDTVDIEVLPGRVEGLKRLASAGYRLVIVSNQHSVAIGVSPTSGLARLTQRMKNAFRQHGVYFDRIIYCTHAEHEGCNCRKPKAGMFEDAIQRLVLNRGACHFIGDSDDDRGVRASLPEMTTHILSEDGSFQEIVDQILEVRDRAHPTTPA